MQRQQTHEIAEVVGMVQQELDPVLGEVVQQQFREGLPGHKRFAGRITTARKQAPNGGVSWARGVISFR
jgi:hypothetical protein